jgi:hypothetical protein
MLVEDTAATARTIERRTPVVATHRRLGNKSNPRKIKSTNPAVLIPAASNEGEEINTTVDQPTHPAPQRNDPPPAMHSHLRVISRRGRF